MQMWTPLLVAMAMVGMGCSKQDPAPPPPVVVDAEPADTTADAVACVPQAPCAVADVALTVTAIEDSRCPVNATCIQAGDAAVTVTVGAQQVTLHSNTAMGEAGLRLEDGRTLLLVAVEPLPQVNAPASAKTASFRLEAARPVTFPY